MRSISLTEDAYEALEAHRRTGQSLSEVVRRLAGCVTLAEYHGVLEADTADELEAVIGRRRRRRTDTHRKRVAELAGDLDE